MVGMEYGLELLSMISIVTFLAQLAIQNSHMSILNIHTDVCIYCNVLQ